MLTMFLLKATAIILSSSLQKNRGTSLIGSLPKMVFIISCFLIFCEPLSIKAQPCLIPILNNTIDIKPAGCVGTVATLQGSIPLGGTGVYSYQWEKSIGNCGSGNFQPIPGATSKDYAVPSSTDVNDCFRRIVTSGTCTSTSNNTKVQNSDRSTPAPPTVSIVNSSCAAGTGIITVTSPSPSAGTFYSIDGTTYTNTSGIFTGLVPATYNVTVKYPADCISPVRTATVSSLTTVTGTISPSSASFCAGGSQVLTVTGGSSYQWYKDGVAITGATSNTYTATASGTYTADIISGVCRGTASNSAVVTVKPLPSGAISPSSGIICPPSGTVSLSVSGGTSYQWFKNGVNITGATSANYTANSAGTYTVNITLNGCTAAASNSAVISQGVAPSGFISPASALICPGGNVPLTITTASGSNSYQWFRNGVLINGATGSIYNATQTGTYSVIIFNGSCNGTASNTVNITDAATINFTATPTNPNCASPTGSIAVTGVTGGGSSNYLYSKDNGVNYQSSSSFTNVAAGTYSIVVKDTAGCISSARTVTIQSFTSTLSASANTINTSCGLSNGVVVVNATGGTSPYNYKLDNGNFQAANSFNGLSAGNHNVTVKDAPGCTFTVSFSITQASVNPNLVITPPSVCPGFTISLEAKAVTAGSDTLLSYTYWADTAATIPLNNATAVIAGKYFIKATNMSGCSTIKPVTVTTKPDCLADGKVFVPTAFTPNNNGKNDVLRPILYAITELHYFKVYNRWGQLVFETNAIGKGWDGIFKGSAQPSEIYSWILECVGKNGEIIKESGKSFLIR